MTPTPTTRATAQMPFGTRAVRHILGADPADLPGADHHTAPVSVALARQVRSAASRVDELDARIARDTARLARDTARLARDTARLGAAEDADLQFSWGHLVDRVQHLAADQLCFHIWHEALNAAAHTHAHAHGATPATTGSATEDRGIEAATEDADPDAV
ncbi:hypothetical protein OG216_08685 [Streptomycetaceae bacterium NBC_01309]